MTDKEIVADVKEKLPYQLYQLIRLLDQDDPELIGDAQIYLAKLMKSLYLENPKKLIPRDPKIILDQLIAFEDETETEINEIGRRLMRIRHEAYIEEHDLQWVLDAIDKNTPDKSMSRDLDYEFVFWHHKVLGVDFPSDPDAIADLFGSWLTIASYL